MAEAGRVYVAGKEWDCVHMHNPFPAAGITEALGPDQRYIYTVHSPVEMEMRITWSTQGLPGKMKLLLGLLGLNRLEYDVLDKSVALQTLSKFTRKCVERIHGFGQKTSVIPHWRRAELKRIMDKEEARRRLGWSQDKLVFFTVRRHVKRMGIDIAIEALSGFAEKDSWQCYIAGEGPLHRALKEQAEVAGCGDKIVFPGRISDEDLLLAYQAADLFLLPTRALECFGLITLEAYSFGCPVLGTDAGATPELIDPITPELIVPAGDTDAMRSKIGSFLDGQLKIPDADEIENYVEQNFNQKRIVDQLETLFFETPERGIT
jgi:glycosyltransferase involved in cell wall biosynthesis